MGSAKHIYLIACGGSLPAQQLSQFTFQFSPSILSARFGIPTAKSRPMGVCAVNPGVYVFGLMGRFL
jgi:hypothetical protein